MRYAFDLDGTLVDSREAILSAYHLAGANPPPNFFMLSRDQWLVGPSAEEVHKAKNKIYIKSIPTMVRRLPLMDLYEALCWEERVEITILTGASREAARAVMKAHSRKPYYKNDMICGITVSEKIAWMNDGDIGIMFEDQEEAAKRMKKETQWTICHTLS